MAKNVHRINTSRRRLSRVIVHTEKPATCSLSRYIYIYIYIYTHIYIGVDISVHLHFFFVCNMIGIRLEPGFDWTPIEFR
jgi:hypothetical protein